MQGTVHACIGAAVGSLFRNSRAKAFVAGVASHIIGDLIPHTDADPALDVPVMIGVLAGIAKWKGIDSTEFAGALGAVSPDAEHGLAMAGIIRPEQKIFPTHIDDGKYHAPETGENISQLLIGGAALLFLALTDSKESSNSSDSDIEIP